MKRILSDLVNEKSPENANFAQSPRAILAEHVVELLSNRRRPLGRMTITEAANHLEVNPSLIHRARVAGSVTPQLFRAMAHAGHIHHEDVRRALTVEVEPCLKCGDVHTLAHCNASGAGRLPDDTHRFAVYVDDETWAALTHIKEANNWGNSQLLEHFIDAYRHVGELSY